MSELPAAEIFRAYDIRGLVPEMLNESAARLVGQALGAKAKAAGSPAVLVARDGRLSSPGLAQALAEGLNAMGMPVRDAGMMPTPTAYWGAKQHTDGNSVVITGSHNPKSYNGIKMTLGGVPLAGEEVTELRAMIESGLQPADQPAATEPLDGIVAAYADAVLAGPRLARPVKVVVDCGNGVAGPSYPEVLRRLGCEVSELYCDIDGEFPNHHPDPAVPENFKDAVAKMEAERAEMVLAFDGDGDRLGVWLPEGILYPDRILMLLTRELLARKPGSEVVYDVKSTANLGPFIVAAGGKPHVWRTGHSFMKKELAKRGAPLGGELSGHFYFNEEGWSFDDPLLTAVRLLRMVAEAESATQLSATVPDSYATPEYTVPLGAAANPHALVEKLVAAQQFDGAPQIVTIDGLRADWEDGFGLVRASNTTPSIIMRFEGKEPAARDRIRDAFASLIAAVDASVEMPF